MTRRAEGPKFQIGDIVTHKHFGQGTVVGIAGPRTNGAGEVSHACEIRFESGKECEIAETFLTLEREVHRIDALRQAVARYGDETWANYQLLTKFGHDLLSSMARYMHRGQTLVRGVPPCGEWDPEQEYRHEAFSSFGDPVLTLEPTDLGMAIRIDNLSDTGSLWVRIVITLKRSGQKLLLSIGDQYNLALPLQYEGDIEQACAMIFGALHDSFDLGARETRSGLYGEHGAIGFLTKEPRQG